MSDYLPYNQESKSSYKDYNVEINKVGIVEPPLGRTLSKPAVDYQKAMIGFHDTCKDEISEIINFLKKS